MSRIMFLFMILLLLGCSQNEGSDEKILGSETIKKYKRDSVKVYKIYNQYLDTLESDIEASKELLDELLELTGSLTADRKELLIRIYANIAIKELNPKNNSTSDSLIRLAEQYAKELKDSSEFPNIYHKMGLVKQKIGLVDSAIFYYKKSIKYAEITKNTGSLLPVQINLGTQLLRSGKTQLAIDNLKKVRELCIEKRDTQLIADVNTNLASAYNDQLNITMALHYYKSAIELLEKINSTKNYLVPLNNIANIYTTIGNDSMAMHYYKKIYNMALMRNNKTMIMVSMLNIGYMYYEMENNKLAREFTENALDMLSPGHQTYYHAVCFVNLGSIYMRDKREVEGLNYLKRARQIAQKVYRHEIVNEASIKIAKYYLEKDQMDSVMHYATESYKISDKLNIIYDQSVAANMLAKVYTQINDYEKAVKYYEVYVKTNAEYQDTLNQREIRNFGYNYDLQRKDAENKLLIKDSELKQQIIANNNSKIKQQRTILLLEIVLLITVGLLVILLVRKTKIKTDANIALRAKNSEIRENNKKLANENIFKNKLFSIISHELRGPVVNIYQMLRLSLEEGESVMSYQTLANRLLENTKRTLVLLDNLILWTRQQLNKESVDFIKFDFESIVSDSFDLFKYKADEHNINLINNVHPETYCYADKYITQLILRNLISNSLKYTPDNGTVSINAEEINNKIVISVVDTGTGFNQEFMESIFKGDKFHTTLGIRNEKGHGIGLKLCKYFVEKNKGKIWFESKANEGSKFYFSLKKFQA